MARRPGLRRVVLVGGGAVVAAFLAIQLHPHLTDVVHRENCLQLPHRVVLQDFQKAELGVGVLQQVFTGLIKPDS